MPETTQEEGKKDSDTDNASMNSLYAVSDKSGIPGLYFRAHFSGMGKTVITGVGSHLECQKYTH